MTFKRSVVSAAVLGASVFSGGAVAGVSGNVGVSSQYLFRGIEQNGDAAVSGGLDYAHDSGFYVGTWASTINFNGVSASGVSTEVDLYAGFSGEAGSLSYDLGAIYYWYPEEGELDPKPDPSNNTFELYGSLSFGPATIGLYYSLADYFAVTDEGVMYPYLDLSFPMSDKLSLDLHVGQQTFEEDGIEDIVDYSIGVSADAGNGFSMGLAFVATDIDDDDPKLVVSGSYSFDL
ncbi:TorF family putative porin [Sinimarinibacterium thermocellulolyticum]|uniref:TorF family putative porin n=1 Tax=Sinimarinibacterium thermocellulolyticum TaxID=3170016 RepID=A0ABV2A9R6_9GAMM